MDKIIWYNMLKNNEISSLSMAQIAKYWVSNSKEWYHLLGNIDDAYFLTSVSSLKIYSICRCHLEADDGSFAHEHFHALVHIENTTKLGMKKKFQRLGISLNPKTTFKKIHCLDHVVGVLRYICCKDGQKMTRRDGDGLMGKPHTHYSRSVFDEEWLRSRGKQCGKIINDIC